MDDTVTAAISAVAAIGFMPVVVAAIGGIRKARAERRRQAMFDRHAERIGR